MDTPSKKDMVKIKKLPERAIKWIGSTASLLIHTLLFIFSFLLPMFHIVAFSQMLLVLTTIVSLEAIYLSIFIQMSVNRSNQYIEIIHEDVDEISENVDEISDNIDEMQKEDEEEDEDDIKESEVLDTIKETLLMLQKEVISLRKSRTKK